MNEVAPQRLVTDLKVLIDDVGELLRVTAGDTRARIVDMRRLLEQKVAKCKKELAEQEGSWLQRADRAKTTATTFLQDDAWRTVVIAVGIGLILGFILRRQ